ncbi:hypothetical protein D3C71_2119140 [compost metagenome]
MQDVKPLYSFIGSKRGFFLLIGFHKLNNAGQRRHFLGKLRFDGDSELVLIKRIVGVCVHSQVV